jgi:Cu(I)/Ag(I) efflux system membrane fusion protein
MNRLVLGILPPAALFCLLAAGSGQFFPPLSALRPAEALAASDMPGMPGMEANRPAAQPATAPVESTPKETPTIEISPEEQQMIGVKTVAVSRQTIARTIRTVGRIQYDEKRIGTVSPKIGGWIEDLYVDFTGQFVRKGEPLLTIYSPELVSTQEEYLLALKAKQDWSKSPFGEVSEGGNFLAASARRRLKLWDINDAQIKALEESGEPQKTLTLYSPFTGYVIEKMINKGQFVDAGMAIYKIADLSTIWVIADIYEYELPLIRLGQTTRVRLSYLPGKEFVSKIDYLYPSLSGESRTARARLVIPNPGGSLMPQMFTNIEITIDLGKRLAVPDAAVIDTGTRKIVYVDKGEGHFEPREVLTGLRGEKMLEIVQGLKEGNRVASSANFLIDSEAQLQGVVPVHRP